MENSITFSHILKLMEDGKLHDMLPAKSKSNYFFGSSRDPEALEIALTLLRAKLTNLISNLIF